MLNGEAEKKNISRLDFNINDALNSLDEVDKKLKSIAESSEAYGKQISKNLNITANIDVSNVNKNLKEISNKKIVSNKVTNEDILKNDKIYIRNSALQQEKLQGDLEKIQARKVANNEKANQKILNSEKTIADKIQEYAKTYLIYQGFNQLKKVISDTIDEMVNVEYQMIEIDRVLNDSSLNIDNYRDKLIKLAYDYGNSFDNVADITLRLAQAGFDANESLALTEKTLLALNTAELNATEATEDMVAVMSQFGLTTGTTNEIASNYGDIIDKINKVADNFPTTSKDILNALKKTGSAFHLAGASIDETIATIVAAEKASQRGGKVIGTALSNIVQQLKAEKKLDLAEELGLNFYKDAKKTEFRPIMEIFQELSERMEKLKNEGKENSVEMQNLLEMFTVFRRNVGASLLGEMAGEDSTYAQVLKTSIDSVGYSLEENTKHMGTAKAAQAQLNAELLKLKTQVWDDGLEDVYRNMLSMGTDLVKNISSLVDTIGVVPSAIGAVTLAVTALNSKIKTQDIIALTFKVKAINQEIANTGKALESDNKLLNGTSKSFKNYVATVDKGKVSLKAYTGSLLKSTIQSAALTAATVVLNTVISVGLSAAITAIVVGLENWIHADEKAIEKNKELIETSKENASKIDEEKNALKEYREEYEELAKKGTRTPEENQRIYEIQTKLNSLIKDTGKQVNLINTTLNEQQKEVTKVNEKYNEQLNVLKQIEVEKQKQKVSELKTAMEAANKNLDLTKFSSVSSNVFSNTWTASVFRKAGIEGTTKAALTGEIGLGNIAYDFNNASIEERIKLLTTWKEKVEELTKQENLSWKDEKESETVLEALTQALKEAKDNYDAAQNSVEAYENALSELISQSSNLTEYNTALSAIFKTYGTNEEISNMIQSLQNLNQNFEDGKITVDEYYNTLKDTIEGINFFNEDGTQKMGAELQGLQAIFAETTRYIVENLESIQNTYDEGESSFSDYADGLIRTNDNLLELYASENNLHYDQEQGWLDANNQLDEYANNLQNLQDQLEGFTDVLSVMSENYSYIAENADAFGNAAFEASNLADKSYKQLAINFADSLSQMQTTNKEAFDNIMAEVYQVTGSTSNELANSNTYLRDVFLSNNNALNAALNEAAGQAQTAANNMAQSTGKLIEKLGDAISKFDYTIDFGIEGGIEPGGNLLDLAKGKKFQPKSDLKLKINGTGGESVTGLGESLKQFASDFSNYYTTSTNYKSLVDLIKPVTPYTPTSKSPASISSPKRSPSGGSKSSSNKEENDTTKAEEEAYKNRLNIFKNYVTEKERLEKRWVDKQKNLGQLSNKDFLYIIEQRINRYKEYINEVRKSTWMSEEDKIALEKEYNEQIEDLQVDYLDYLKDILDEQIDALKEANDKKIELIKQEAEERINALKKVESENDRIRAKEEYEKKRQEHLNDISYWEQRTGREAQEALAEAKKNLQELDNEWKQQLEDWSIDDQIQAIEDERDAQIKAIQDAQEAEIASMKKIYDAKVKLFSETGEIIYEGSVIQSQKLYEAYKKNFVDPILSDLANINKVKTPAPSQSSTPQQQYETYTIKWGDTLTSIARKFGTTIEKIMAANPYVTNKNRIYAGKTLQIPKFHDGGIVGGNQEAFALLKPNEVILKPSWSASLDRMMHYFDNLSSNNQTSITNGPTINVDGDLIRIEANIKNQSDINTLERKLEKMLKDKFNINK